MKLLQLNTWHGGTIWQPMIDFIRDQNADIMHLQEVYFNDTDQDFPDHPQHSLYQYIAGNFPYPYHAFSTYYKIKVDGDTRLPLGNATFSKYPLHHSKVIYMPDHRGFNYEDFAEQEKPDFSFGPANFLQCDIDIDGKTFRSINMHGVWGFDGLDNDRRTAMSNQVMEAIDGHGYVICSGDFNTTPNAQAMKKIGEKLHDVFAGELTSTFNPLRWKKAVTNEFVVDYVFLSKNLNVTHHEKPEVDITDHMPLVVEFEL